jgi:3-hydroxybutyryl-CoA dehydrogenase
MRSVGVIGAGVMGAGIAQLAASHGRTVKLLDVADAVVARAIDGIAKRLDRLAEKGNWPRRNDWRSWSGCSLFQRRRTWAVAN